jgi:hypothetical protein
MPIVLLLLEGFVRRRIAAAAVLAVGLALGTAGCTFFAPQATLLKYDPSDGVALDLGSLQVRNAFAISPKGTDANLVGVFINSGSSEMNLKIQYTSHTGGTAKSVTIHKDLSPGQIISFGNPGVKQAVFRGADVPAGSLLTIFLQYGTVSGENLKIPVLNTKLQAYKHLSPSPLPTHTPTPTPTATPTAISTPAS